MSYCHECGQVLHDSWEPCPKCESGQKSEEDTKEKGILEVPRNVFVFCILSLFFLIPLIIVFDLLFESSPVVLVLFAPYLLFLLSYAIRHEKTKAKSSLSDDLDNLVGDSSNPTNWLRSRFLLMNLFAIGLASLGSVSVVMNHIMFWGALILGGLIWSAPKKSNIDSKTDVDELFD